MGASNWCSKKAIKVKDKTGEFSATPVRPSKPSEKALKFKSSLNKEKIIDGDLSKDRFEPTIESLLKLKRNMTHFKEKLHHKEHSEIDSLTKDNDTSMMAGKDKLGKEESERTLNETPKPNLLPKKPAK